MPNKKLSIDEKYLDDQFIIIKNDWFKEKKKFAEPKTRVALARFGFGCSPTTIGSAVYVTHVINGEEFRIERYHVERFASKEEIKNAKEMNK